jgi:ATP-binding cassette, subfamily B, bacterial CvaB/MchF/RaxB
VLDEATSELDVGNEKIVTAAIRNMGLTRIIAAQRTETIAMADRVLAMKKGRLYSANDFQTRHAAIGG